MRKLFALLLVLVMCVSIFAACGEAKEPAAKEEPGKTEEPDAPKLKPGMQADGKTFIGILDQTDEFTLVI